MSVRKAGSRWPSSGVAIAVRTRGWTSQGPGPRSKRCGGLSWAGRDTSFSFLLARRASEGGPRLLTLSPCHLLHSLLHQRADRLELRVRRATEPFKRGGLGGGEDSSRALQAAQGDVAVG